MESRWVDPGDATAVAGVVELINAGLKVDAPFSYPETPSSFAGMLRHGWDGEPPRASAVHEAGRVAGIVLMFASRYDNPQLSWVWLAVHPDLRRRGVGRRLLELAGEQTRALGRSSMVCEGWDNDATRGFAAAHRLEPKSRSVLRRQVLSSVDPLGVDRAYEEAASVAASYELLKIAGRTPDDMLEAVAELTNAINDAPTDDLAVEDEVFTSERIVSYETAQLARGHRLYRLVARHRDTCELAVHTVVAVEEERPWIGWQHDTSVVRAHRGHRLGLLLKAEMLRWLREVEPGLETIDTWNAESNRHMIEVNERLGYQVLGRQLQFQIAL